MEMLIVNGSPRKDGETGVLARLIAEKYSIQLFDLSITPLPLFNGEEGQENCESVKTFKSMIRKADGIILCSPEYHNGMSGALKNALDFLSGRDFDRKPVVLMAVAGGGKGGINCLNNMRTVMRGLYATVLAKQLVVDAANVHPLQPKHEVDELLGELKEYVELLKKNK